MSPLKTPKPCRTCAGPVLFRKRAEKTSSWVPLDATPAPHIQGSREGRLVRGWLAYLPEQLAVDDQPLAFESRPRRAGKTTTLHTVHVCPKEV